MADTILDFSEFVHLIHDALEEAGIPYLIGGALAAWAWGEPRTTRDVDLVVEIHRGAAEPLSRALKNRDIHLPADIILATLNDDRGDLPLNAIHGPSGYKADLYLLREGDTFRAEAFRRRILVDLGPELGELYLHTPEDLIVNKLYYYSLTHQTKHLRDITAIVENLGEELDEVYIQRWAGKKGLQILWENLRRSMQGKK
jgi:hypothetical protein